MVDKYPELYDHRDTEQAFRALAEKLGFRVNTHFRVARNWGVECWCCEPFFEKLFKLLFLAEGLLPTTWSEGVQGGSPLPSLFIGSEKTQIRQIPLSVERPWPFKFLLELGGMIVVRTDDKREFLKELKQYVNNHPQYQIGLHAKERPDGTIAIFTYWFEEVSKKLRKENLNVE